MKAWTSETFGAPADVLRLEDVPVPEPGEGQVRVRVRAASVNALDWHHVLGEPLVARLGGLGLRTPARRVCGADLAGVVDRVGSGVADLAPGDRVMGVAAGSFAELAVAERAGLVPIPDGVDDVTAAATPVAGATALQGLRDHGRVRPGQRVLVTGASSGVGTFAVQLARHLGAEVTGSCSTANVGLVSGLGADHVVDRLEGPVPPPGERYDVVLHVAGTQSPATLRRALVPGGVVVHVTGDGGRWLGPVGRIVTGLLGSLGRQERQAVFTADETAEGCLAELAALLADGTLRPAVTRTVPLADAAAAVADAHAARIPGKTVVVVGAG